MSELFELMKSVTDAHMASFKAGHKQGYHEGYREGFKAAMDDARRIVAKVLPLKEAQS